MRYGARGRRALGMRKSIAADIWRSCESRGGATAPLRPPILAKLGESRSTHGKARARVRKEQADDRHHRTRRRQRPSATHRGRQEAAARAGRKTPRPAGGQERGRGPPRRQGDAVCGGARVHAGLARGHRRQARRARGGGVHDGLCARGRRAAPRPVCFAFNGGPGRRRSGCTWARSAPSASGPDDGTMPEPPYAVVDNPLSWFEHFDLVFIDPPHTG